MLSKLNICALLSVGRFWCETVSQNPMRTRLAAALASDEDNEYLNADNQDSILARSGARVDTSGDVWRLSPEHSINWLRMPLTPGPMCQVTEFYFKNLIRMRSPSYVHNQFSFLQAVLVEAVGLGLDINNPDTYDASFFERIKIALLEWVSAGTTANYLDAFRRWYLWGSDQEYEAFDEEHATDLENRIIGGNLKGAAVLSDDADEGPLRFAELCALQVRIQAEIHAANQGEMDDLDSLLIIWLAMSFGVYPLAMSYLNEEDLICTELSDGRTFYELRIPRLKKGNPDVRSQFHTRPVDPAVGALFEEKIRSNRGARRFSMLGEDPRRYQNPMFPRESANPTLLDTDFEPHAFRSPKQYFNVAINNFVWLHELKSEKDGPLRVTPRRLRYTFATRLVQEGASPLELADALDHTDLQNVMVYFNSRSDVVVSLDKAMAATLAPLAQAFLGEVIKDVPGTDRRKELGYPIYFFNEKKQTLEELSRCKTLTTCGLVAPIACYTCPKFKPWAEGPHDIVLDKLFDERKEHLDRGADPKITQARDVTIVAVAEVVRLSKIALNTDT